MSTEGQVISLVIADDSPDFREGLRGMLDAASDTRVIGEAASGEEAIALAGRLQPDVMLMDLQMPGCNGIEATRRVVATSPHIGVLVLTMFEDDDSIFAAMRAGARGYVLKGAPKAEVMRAIRSVAIGEAIFSPNIARRLMRYFASDRPVALPFPELTDREREVLGLIAQNQGNVEISRQLSVSLKTIQNHVANICSKLQVTDRTHALLRAREAGLGEDRRY